MVAGLEVLASVRTRAEVRGTTVYASAKLSSLETSKVFQLNKSSKVFAREHRRCFH